MPSRRTGRGAARSRRGRWAKRCGSTRSPWRPLRGARRTPRAARSPRDRHGRRATTPLARVSHGSRAPGRVHDLRVTVRVTALLPRLTGVWDDPERRGAARPHGIGNGTHRGGARLLALGEPLGRALQPGADARVLSPRQDRTRGRPLVRDRAVCGRRGGHDRGARARSHAARASGRKLRGHSARAGWYGPGVRRRSRHFVRPHARRPDRVQPDEHRALDRRMRGTARGHLYHRRKPDFGDEHEPGSDLRICLRGRNLDRLVALLHRSAPRHARRRGAVSPLARGARRVLRQALPSCRRAVHLLRASPRRFDLAELKTTGTIPRPPALSPPRMNSHYDVIIIGTGAGGGTLAHRLAPSGKRILLVERGDYVPREKENWDTRAVVLEGRYGTKEAWPHTAGNDRHPHTNYYVGGNTKFYGAALFRLRQRDFRELRHHGGISPAWPISYDELEPYYTEAERLYHVHGERGLDPTEPPARAPYPFPRVSHEPRIQQLSDDLSRIGLRPFHVPLGIMLDEQHPRQSACIRCDTCDGHPCLIYAKSDAQVCCVDPALEHPNVTLLTNAYVARLETAPSGRAVAKVHVQRNSAPETYTGDIVVVSCGAINSAALLLRSANERHPNGLANGSGVVGRHYMSHINSIYLAISKCANPTRFQKTLAVNDFYFGSKEWDYPMGHISFVGKTDGNVLAAGAPRIVPGMTLELMARHSLDFWLTSEDLPDPNNRVTVDPEGTIRLSYTPNNHEGHERLIAKLKEVLEPIGCEKQLILFFSRQIFLGQGIPLAGVAHQNGTIRFGNDPETSALDRNCKAHELDNLYVVDGSFFPSSGAVNPALTIMANALRVGDHILERLQ